MTKTRSETEMWTDKTYGNEISINDDLGQTENGAYVGGATHPNGGKYNKSEIPSGNADDPVVIAHEMIHMLGGNNKVNGIDRHAEDGLMQKDRTENQSQKIYESTINDIVKNGYGSTEERHKFLRWLRNLFN